MQSFYYLFLKGLEIGQGALDSNRALEALECWDSVPALIYMALDDEKLGITVTSDRIVDCKTGSNPLRRTGDKLIGK